MRSTVPCDLHRCVQMPEEHKATQRGRFAPSMNRAAKSSCNRTVSHCQFVDHWRPYAAWFLAFLEALWKPCQAVQAAGSPSMLNLTAGFKAYGRTRPAEVKDALLKSALVSRGISRENASMLTASSPPAPVAPPGVPYAGTMLERGLSPLQRRSQPGIGQGRALSSLNDWTLSAARYASGDEQRTSPYSDVATCTLEDKQLALEVADVAMDAFFEEWRERLEGWWIATPMRNELQSCFGSLSHSLVH